MDADVIQGLGTAQANGLVTITDFREASAWDVWSNAQVSENPQCSLFALALSLCSCRGRIAPDQVQSMAGFRKYCSSHERAVTTS